MIPLRRLHYAAEAQAAEQRVDTAEQGQEVSGRNIC